MRQAKSPCTENLVISGGSRPGRQVERQTRPRRLLPYGASTWHFRLANLFTIQCRVIRPIGWAFVDDNSENRASNVGFLPVIDHPPPKKLLLAVQQYDNGPLPLQLGLDNWRIPYPPDATAMTGASVSQSSAGSAPVRCTMPRGSTLTLVLDLQTWQHFACDKPKHYGSEQIVVSSAWPADGDDSSSLRRRTSKWLVAAHLRRSGRQQRSKECG